MVGQRRRARRPGTRAASVRDQPRAHALVALVARIDRAASGGTARRGRRSRCARRSCAGRRRRGSGASSISRPSRQPSSSQTSLRAAARSRSSASRAAGSAAAVRAAASCRTRSRGSRPRRGRSPASQRTRPRSSARRRGPLEDRHAVTLACERRARGPAAPDRSRAACGVYQPPRSPGTLTSASACGRGQQPAVALLVARRAASASRALQRAATAGRSSRRQRARLAEAAVDLLARGDRADLVDRLEGRAQRAPARGRGSSREAERRAAADEPADRPAAVAPRRPEAGDLALDHHDAQVAAGASCR